MSAREPRFTTESEFEEKVVQVRRVSKKTKGGNQIGFSVLMVVGDKKGRVAAGLGKAPDVRSGIEKGISYAKKHLIKIPLKSGTIPHEVKVKLGAAKILLKPAPPGTGIIAGSTIRDILEVAGVENVIGKALGTRNKISNAHATMKALKRLKGTQ